MAAEHETFVSHSWACALTLAPVVPRSSRVNRRAGKRSDILSAKSRGRKTPVCAEYHCEKGALAEPLHRASFWYWDICGAGADGTFWPG